MSNGTTAIPVSPIAQIMQELQQGEVAKARVPELEAANRQLTDKLDTAQYHNQRLEENILGYKNQISELIAKVRSLEVERDDASFRTLEAEDRLATLLKTVRTVAHALDSEAMHVDPPKPEPKPEPVAEVRAESALHPTADATGTATQSTSAVVNAERPSDAVGTSEYKPFTPPSAVHVDITEGKEQANPSASYDQPLASPSAPTSHADQWDNASHSKTEPGPDTFHPTNPDPWWKNPAE